MFSRGNSGFQSSGLSVMGPVSPVKFLKVSVSDNDGHLQSCKTMLSSCPGMWEAWDLAKDACLQNLRHLIKIIEARGGFNVDEDQVRAPNLHQN